MFLCAIDLNIGIFVDFSHIVLLYQLCVSSSRRHNDTQQTCFVKCKDIFQTKISLKLFIIFFAVLLLLPDSVSQCGSGEKKRCSFLFCALACRPLSFSRTTLDNRFFGQFHILRDLRNRLNNPTLADHVGDTCMYKTAASLPSPPCHSQPLRGPLTVQIASQSDFKYVWVQRMNHCLI